jgi:hypothetical protein
VLRPVTQPAAPAPAPAKAARGGAARKPGATADPVAAPAPKAERLPLALLRKAIEQGSGDSKWAGLGAVGQYISKVRPDFDPRLYGCRKLSDLFRANPKYFEVEERGQGESKSLYVRAVE